MERAMDEDSQSKPSQRGRKAVLSYIGVTLLVGCFLFAYTSTSSQRSHAESAAFSLMTELKASSSEPLRLEAINAYSETDGIPGQHYPWLAGKLLAEPYQPTTFKVVGHDPTKEYEWAFYNAESGVREVFLSGSEVEHEFTRDDVWSDKILIVTEYETDSEDNSRKMSNLLNTQLYVRYVRREIRDLLPEDREEVFDAMALHWKVSQDKGTELYGPDYRSMLTLLKYHLAAAADNECDHFHEGYGFIQQHSALTILFEQSLQAVNPKLAMPYWDYVQDFEHLTQLGRGYLDFNKGDMFTADYFGSTDGDYHIADGRWAGLAIPTVLDLETELERSQVPHNAYGHLRSPWSIGSDAKLVRASKFCGVDGYWSGGAADCAAVTKLTELHSFQGWYEHSSLGPHGPAHHLTGGALACKGDWDAVEEAGVAPAIVRTYRGMSFHYLKTGWRGGKIECSSTAGCTCVNYNIYKKSPERLLTFLSDDLTIEKVEDLTEEQRAAVLEAVCNSGIYFGDMMQSSASWAPEFWPVHGNLERMYQLRILKGDWQQDGEFSWDVNSWLPHQISCYGHGPDDLVLLGRDQIKVKGVPLDISVEDFLIMTEPAHMHKLDYIYNNVEWANCKTPSLVF